MSAFRKRASPASLNGRATLLESYLPKEGWCINALLPGESAIRKINPTEFKAWTGVTYLPYLIAENSATFFFACKCCRRGEAQGHFVGERQWLACWHSAELADTTTPGVYLQYIDPSLGLGLFALNPLPKGALIGAYSGILRRRPLFRRAFNDFAFRYPSGLIPLFRPLIIDAEHYGNELRFANHSDDPNMEGLGLLHGPLVDIAFLTSRPVAAGEQLTYDYGPDFWRSRRSFKHVI